MQTSDSTNPILDRYESLVEDKRAAGLSQALAEKVSYDQIVQDALGGALDEPAAIEFLMSLEIAKGMSAEGAAHIVKPLFKRR